MKVLLFGGTGFIGTNLVFELAKDTSNSIIVVDRCIDYFEHIKEKDLENVSFVESEFHKNIDFDVLIRGQEIVYHLVSTTVPTTSNCHISEELDANVLTTAKLLEACVRQGVKRVVFISSGGTVYGKDLRCPLAEDAPTNPISSYGVQKLAIEKLLYLYNYMYGLDYRVVRLANPYGPYQRPNGVLGAVTTFTYRGMKNEDITVYGDGSVVRDFIYIDDAVKGILNISSDFAKHKLYNLGSGVGVSIKNILEAVSHTLEKDLRINYVQGRSVDVPVNFLDVSRYENEFGKVSTISLEKGICKTSEFLKEVNY